MRFFKKFLGVSILFINIFLSFSYIEYARANPFADIYPEHWSYQATKVLVEVGLVDDYSNSMFAQNKRISKYALVQLIGQAVYRKDEATQEQKIMIEKLREEYKDDLAGFGVTTNPVTSTSQQNIEDVNKRIDELEKNTSGIKNLKVSGMLQTENSYGKRYNDNDADHEYEIEARIQFDKKISDKLSYTHQIATKTYLDAYSADANDNLGYEYSNGNKEKVYTRLAYLTWTPDAKTNLQVGKFAVWLAGGLLGDDYVKGAMYDYDNNDWQFSLLASRYSSNTSWPGMAVISDGQGGYKLSRTTEDKNIFYAKIGKKIGATNVGVHYLGADKSFVSKDNTNIAAVTADFSWNSINWSLGYAQNIDERNDNALYKLQISKAFDNKNEVILQYWRSEQNINMPLEHGNHMAFWTDTYTNRGLQGFRFIYSYKITNNILLEAFYGHYNPLEGDGNASKYGFATTMSF